MEQTATREAAAMSVARARGEGASLDILGSPYLVKAHAAETGGAFCCIESTLPPGAGAPPHTHTREDEVFYVLEGELVFVIGDEAAPVRRGAGSFLFSPRGQLHGFRNEGPGVARLLVLALPGAGLERMFHEMDVAGRRIGGVPSMEEITAIAARAGVVIAG